MQNIVNNAEYLKLAAEIDSDSISRVGINISGSGELLKVFHARLSQKISYDSSLAEI